MMEEVGTPKDELKAGYLDQAIKKVSTAANIVLGKHPPQTFLDSMPLVEEKN